jgi:DNA polymerase III subunit gamma/tau
MTYQVLARKWRPAGFDAVVGQEPTTRTLRNALLSGRVAHAYLFTGPRGVGKTTTARLLAKALCCPVRTGAEACGVCPSCQDFVSGAPVDVMEIDAASNTSVDDIRTLRENVKYAPARARFKVYIVDEVHMLSLSAFNAFLKTLEEPPAHVVFILATTEPKRIPATVLSRCQRFDFKPISPEQLTQSLTEILTKEGVSFEAAALPMLVRAAEGSMRDALSLLDTAIAYGEGRLDEAGVARLLGSSSPVHVRAFVTALVGRDGAAALEAIDRAAQAGEDLLLLCREVIETVRRLLVLKVNPSGAFADLAPSETESLKAAGADATADELIYLLRAFLEADGEMRRSPHPRVELEVAAVRATQRPAPQAMDALLAKVEDALARLRTSSGAPAAPSAGARPAVVQESLIAHQREPAPATIPRSPSPSREPKADSPSPSREPKAERMERPQASGGVQVGDVGLAEGWQRVVGDMMARKALLGSVLQHAMPGAITDGVLTLAVEGNHFHKELLNDRGNRELINQVLSQHLPGVRRFELDAAGPVAGGARNHPAVQAALSVFQGEVVAVRPRAPEEGASQ